MAMHQAGILASAPGFGKSPSGERRLTVSLPR